eukprot:c21713_g4_i1.p1 GENE.c21713_g4_i1~~c21713_g4_i1.p1  ORF type:complete len:495 (+),score=71.01 c21713_g4_i1:308-1792(+)
MKLEFDTKLANPFTQTRAKFFDGKQISNKLGTNYFDGEKAVKHISHKKFNNDEKCSELELQRYWEDIIIKQFNNLNNKTDRHLKSIHNISLHGMKDLRPDIGLFAKDQNNLFHCLCFIELKSGSGVFTSEQRGQLLIDCERALDYLPNTRNFFIGALVNFGKILVYQVTRNPSQSEQISPYTYSELYDFDFDSNGDNNDATSLLYRLLYADYAKFGFIPPQIQNVEIEIQDYLGSGLSGTVYSGSYDQFSNCVVKVFKNPTDYKNEKQILEMLSSCSNIPKILCREQEIRDKSNNCVLIHKNLGTRFQCDRPPVLNQNHVNQLVAVLLHAHQLGIVHRDVTHRNYFHLQDGNVLLNDWASAVRTTRKDGNGQFIYESCSYAGVILECSETLCHSSLSYVPCPKDDLHALARSVFLLHHPKIDQSSFIAEKDQYDYKKISSFWRTLSESSSAWKAVFDLATNSDYTNKETYEKFATELNKCLSVFGSDLYNDFNL